MALRRMFSLKIIDTDDFMELPLSAQALYFHLGLRADDDGFVGNLHRVGRLIGAREGDMALLFDKGYLLDMGGGVVVLTHWRMNNTIRGDRYLPTIYVQQRARLWLEPSGCYSLTPGEGKRALPDPAADETERRSSSRDVEKSVENHVENYVEKNVENEQTNAEECGKLRIHRR